MSDSGASKVRTETRTTVSALRRAAARKVGEGTSRLPGVERTIFRIDARLVSVRRTPARIELVVADRRTGEVLAVSFPDSRCSRLARSPRRREIAGAGEVFLAQCGLLGVGKSSPLRGEASISGVGFFSRGRAGKKAAPGRLWLAPVMSFDARAGCGSRLDGVVLAAGDIATGYNQKDEATAALLDRLPGTVATLGDSVYDRGSASEFAELYEPTWGRHRARTRPAPGNHEYLTPGAAGYFGYFGAAAGDPRKGYYSYDLGPWHLVVLNSECSAVGGCFKGSPQERWLRDDLAAHPVPCVLAYWHVPRFNSGIFGDSPYLADLWQALYDAGADVALAGHAHSYERFAPQTPRGAADPSRGIREFIVGTGGAAFTPVYAPRPNSEVLDNSSHGVLQITLRASSYEWRFVPVPGDRLSDSGSAACH